MLRYQQNVVHHVKSVQRKIPTPPVPLVSPERGWFGMGVFVRGNRDVPPQNTVLIPQSGQYSAQRRH